MPGAVELATGYISLSLSTKNLGNQVTREFAGIERQAGKVGDKSGKRFGTGMSTAVKAGIAGIAGGVIAKTFGSIVTAASSAEQSIGGVQAVFGKHASEIEGASKRAAKAAGLSSTAYQEMATTLGASLKNQGIKDFTGATEGLIGTGADLAAQFGGSSKEAVEALASAMRGESDPIERYGVSLNESAVNAELARKGQDKLTGQALITAKAQARLTLITNQTKDAYGAFARENDTFAGKMQIASAHWDNLKTKIGEVFLPIATKVMAFVADTMLPGISKIGAVLKDRLGPAFKTISLAVSAFFAAAREGDVTSDGVVGFAERVGNAFRAALPAFRAVSGFIVGQVVPAFLRIASAVKDLYAVVVPIIIQIVSGIIGKFKTMSPQIMSIWNSIKDIITGVMFIIREVIQAVTAVIKGIWDRWGAQIMGVVKTVFGGLVNIIGGVLKTISGIIKLFVALIKGDWTGAWNAVKQIFSGIWQALKGILTVATAGLRSTLTAWLSKIKSLWTSAVTAIRTAWAAFWTNIRNTAQAAWNWVQSRIMTVWNTIRNTWTRTQATVRSAWSTFWGNIKSTGAAAIDWVRSKIDTVLTRIRSAFQTAKDNIGRIWAGVKGVVSSPVEWIRNNVYNKPLVPVWNKVAGLVNGPKLAAYARGGVLPGYEPGRDSIPIMASKGEGILRPEVTRALGKDWIAEANRAARRGVGRARRFAQGQVPGFAGGGIVGWMKGLVGSAKSKVGDLKDWVLGGLRAAAEKVLNPVKTLINNAMPSSGVGKTIGGLGHKAIDLILAKIKAEDAAAMPSGPAGSAIATGGWASIYRALRAAGARNFTTYAGHDQGASRSRDITPPSQRIADTARRLSSIWYVIYNRRIASTTYGMRWRPYTRSNPHTDHVHVTLRPGVKAAKGGIVGSDISGLANGGIVRGGRGGMLAMIGEGRRDELVVPLPKDLKSGGGLGAERPITILIDLGDGLTQKVQGLIDENDEFRASLGRAYR